MATSARTAGEAVWEREIAARLPTLLTELLSSGTYGLKGGGRWPDSPRYGVYLLVDEDGAPRYVGRSGQTGRARRAEKPSQGFSGRFRRHTTPVPNAASFAYYVVRDKFLRQGRPLSGTRAEIAADPAFRAEFRLECERIKRGGMRIVGIHDDKLSTVFEVYVATVLGLPQSFATS